jgi:hypothetical protein
MLDAVLAYALVALAAAFLLRRPVLKALARAKAGPVAAAGCGDRASGGGCPSGCDGCRAVAVRIGDRAS